MARARVLLLGQDITERTKELLKITEQKTSKRNKLINNSFKIIADNADDQLTPNNSKSFLNGLNFYYEPFQIFNRDNELIWDGIVRNIFRNHKNKTVAIDTVSKLHKFKDIKIVYKSSGFETPATAAFNIMNQVEFTDFDTKTIQDSINVLTENNCFIKVNLDEEDNLTFMPCIEKLGEYAGADVYSKDLKIHFKTWTPFTGGVSFSLDESKIDKLPNVKGDEKELVNNYSISFDGDNDTPATDATNNNIGAVSRLRFGTKDLPEFSRGVDSIIIFKDKTSAVYIGELYIRRSHIDLETNPRPPDEIGFRLKADNKDFFTINSFFKLSLDSENWIDKVFEVFKTKLDENQNIITIDALEVQE